NHDLRIQSAASCRWTKGDGSRRLAESAGIEPARPFGLVALAPRCLAARLTLRDQASTKTSGVHGANRTRSLRLRTPPLWSIELRGREDKAYGARSRLRTCGLRLRKPALCSAELWVEFAPTSRVATMIGECGSPQASGMRSSGSAGHGRGSRRVS